MGLFDALYASVLDPTVVLNPTVVAGGDMTDDEVWAWAQAESRRRKEARWQDERIKRHQSRMEERRAERRAARRALGRKR